MTDIMDYLAETAKMVNEEIKKYLTDTTSKRYLGVLLGRSKYAYDTMAINKAIVEPAVYLLGRGGKRWRAVFLLTVIEALGKDPKNYIEFSIIPEVIHNGTIIHDDIEDGSEMRRGGDAVHIKYGVDIALNLGDFMFFLPMIALLDSDKLDRNTKIKMLETYQRDMLKLSIGQATDIAWHRSMVSPRDVTEAQYLQMAYSKTGVLASMAAKMGAILAGADDTTIDAVGHFGSTIGVAFQLQDDLLNMTEGGLADMKGGIGEDITEGKVTLLAIKAIERADPVDKKRFVDILSSHTKDQNEINEAIEIIKKYKSDEYTTELSLKLLKEAWSNVDKLIHDSPAKEHLKGIAEFMIKRSI